MGPWYEYMDRQSVCNTRLTPQNVSWDCDVIRTEQFFIGLAVNFMEKVDISVNWMGAYVELFALSNIYPYIHIKWWNKSFCQLCTGSCYHMLALYEGGSSTIDFIDEKRSYGATENNGRLRIETTQKLERTSRIIEESVYKQDNLRQTLNEYLVSI